MVILIMANALKIYQYVFLYCREGDSCEQCIKRPGCSIHGSCINKNGTENEDDDVMEALTCHCNDPKMWTGSLCDQGLRIFYRT